MSFSRSSELLLRKPLFFLIYFVRNSQKSCRATLRVGRSKDGGFSANLLVDSDRGYADGVLNFFGDKALDIDKAAEFLCADCLNKILPPQPEECFGVGVIHLSTKEVQVFGKRLGGFGLGDFHVKCSLTNRYRSRMNILIFYCPIRYEENPQGNSE